MNIASTTIALCTGHGVNLPAPLAVLKDLLVQEVTRSFGASAQLVAIEHPVAADHLLHLAARFDRVIVILERTAQHDDKLQSSLRSSRVLWAGLQGPGRRPGPLPPALSTRIRLDG